MSKILLISAVSGLTLCAGFAAYAAVNAAPQDVAVTAQCTTDATGLDGRRKACDSEWQRVQAPAGYVLAKETTKGGLVSANGSETECRVQFGDAIEVIPGLPQPTNISLQAHARSPNGHATGRGWATCKYSVRMVPLPKPDTNGWH
ncbi:hypothetical protein AS026_37960 [Rhizobium altiplani]|uniref:Uncharacterized protein n=1 Tax=Rhizobium altiplani TaxID=1864509 RepID=A0A120FNB6_9HYPH|nr:MULTISPECIES: hypothetical protein [Rhizobium]KWV55161.1 hypothetical protein AS026_37960 [Rhizobium altiplani]